MNYTVNTVNKVNKSRSFSRTSLSTEITRIENPLEIEIHKVNASLSDLSGHV